MLRSTTVLKGEKYNQYNVSVVSENINAVFNVSKGDRIKRLVFAFNPLYNANNFAIPGALTAAGENIVTRRGGGLCAYQYPMSNVPLPVRQI